jgi:hypothetical protein
MSSDIDFARQQKLEDLCRKFIKDNTISCPEAICDCDRVSENSPELIEGICDLLGYHEYEDED